ncbi:MAG TPA: hypothetical protein VNT30_21550 [Stellaceae bacterium]|nr:hypothetical protein [Stellaceae bacterium]
MKKFMFALMLATAAGIAMPVMAAPLSVEGPTAHAASASAATTASKPSLLQHVVVKKKPATTTKKRKKAPVHKPVA